MWNVRLLELMKVENPVVLVGQVLFTESPVLGARSAAFFTHGLSQHVMVGRGVYVSVNCLHCSKHDLHS